MTEIENWLGEVQVAHGWGHFGGGSGEEPYFSISVLVLGKATKLTD